MSKYTAYIPIYKRVWGGIKAVSYVKDISKEKLSEIFQVTPRTIMNYENSCAPNLTLQQLDNFLRLYDLQLEDLIK